MSERHTNVETDLEQCQFTRNSNQRRLNRLTAVQNPAANALLLLPYLRLVAIALLVLLAWAGEGLMQVAQAQAAFLAL